jgi:hypothetical protein
MKTTIIPLLNLITETAIGLTSSEWKVESAFKNGATKCCYTLHTGKHVLNDCSNQVNVVYNNVRSILNAGFAITKSCGKVAFF